MSTPMPGYAYWSGPDGQLPNNKEAVVFFDIRPWRNNKKSDEAGFDPDDHSKGIFEDKLHLNVLVADPTLRISRIPTIEDKRKYKRELEEFERTKEGRIPGIPIERWPQITESQKLSLKSLGVMTVEMLANYSDGAGQNIMGFQDLREKARKYLNVGAGEELIAKATAAANAKVAEMTEKMAALEARLAAMEQPEDAA